MNTAVHALCWLALAAAAYMIATTHDAVGQSPWIAMYYVALGVATSDTVRARRGSA